MRGGVSQTVTTPWASQAGGRRAAPVAERWQVVPLPATICTLRRASFRPAWPLQHPLEVQRGFCL